ncbi:hypothetical protein [Micromonospora sp. NPDC005324]|uniref:hypothetical protein n=1 Tax=Micromonospora sp. NPDC005324 TaxID=3157033 RepID=UPI0033B34F01
MENTGGPRATDPPRRHTEYGYLILGVAAIVLATTLFLVDHLTPVIIPFGTYPLLANLFGAGICGWVVRSSDLQRQDLAQRLARVEAALAALAEQRDVGIRQARPVATHRPGGHMYVSGAQGETIGFRRGTVDAPTDPSGATLQRAREDGIEQGFEIGYTAQLAERGVTPLLHRARRSRLMGDS